MLRRFISSLLVVMLFLQGMAPVSADVLPDPPAQHCDGHAKSADDCACCPEGVVRSGGCAAVCSLGAVLLVTALGVPPAEKGGHPRLVVSAAPGPAYLPLNPPPIS